MFYGLYHSEHWVQIPRKLLVTVREEGDILNLSLSELKVQVCLHCS